MLHLPLPPLAVPADLPGCLACGTCCFSTLARYVPVSGDDHARLGDAAERLVHWEENRAYLRLEDGHCAALAIDPSAGPIPSARSTSKAPQTCRDLERGSPQCEGERDTKSDRPRALSSRQQRSASPRRA